VSRSPLRVVAPVLAVVAAAAAPGCDLAPDVGPPQIERCLDEDGDPDNDVRWSVDIAPILARDEVGCARCHDPAGGNAVGVQLSGLDLSSYASLREGGARSGSSIVVPGAPCSSILYQKVLPGPPFGGRMPLDGPPYLSASELALIHDWIAEGAKND